MSCSLYLKDNYFIPDELYNMMQRNEPSELHTCLRKMSYVKLALRVIESRKEGHVSILILAALYGYEDFVRVLLSWDPSREHVDLRGHVYGVNGKLVENVTALWCALDRRHYKVASFLIDKGNASSLCGPYQSRISHFIETGRLDIIQFLASNDRVTIHEQKIISDAHYHYLDLAARLGHTDIVIYFLSRGYERDIREGFVTSKALHLAAEHGHFDCVRILCGAGLSPKTKDSNGKTALRLAAENNHLDIVGFLLEYNNNETSFDEMEFLASSYMFSTWQFGIIPEQVDRMRSLLKLSLMKRLSLNIPKAVAQPIAAYNFQQECSSIEDFHQIEHNVDRLHIEALLIRERILLPDKDETLFPPLHQRGIALVERGEFDRCFQLWLHTFRLYQRMELETDLQNFVWLFCRMFAAGMPISIDQFLEICYLVFHPSQKKCTNERLAAALCLMAIGAKLLEQDTINSVERHSIFQWIQCLCRDQPTTEESARTLLHLSVSDQTYKYIKFEMENIQSVLIFPNTQTTVLILHCGRQWIDLDAVDRVRGDTALHRITRSLTGVNAIPIIKLLINAGAHIDCINNDEQTPADVAMMDETRLLLQSTQRLPQLKCLCARLITTQQLNYDLLWPHHTILNRFILLHGDLSRKHSICDECSSVDDLSTLDFSDYD